MTVQGLWLSFLIIKKILSIISCQLTTTAAWCFTCEQFHSFCEYLNIHKPACSCATFTRSESRRRWRSAGTNSNIKPHNSPQAATSSTESLTSKQELSSLLVPWIMFQSCGAWLLKNANRRSGKCQCEQRRDTQSSSSSVLCGLTSPLLKSFTSGWAQTFWEYSPRGLNFKNSWRLESFT